MLTTARTRIDRWLGQLLGSAGEGESVGIVLLHAAVDQSQRTVKSWKLGDAVGNLEAFVAEIDEVAEGDAEGLGGRQRYVVRALAKGRDIGSLTLRYEQRPEDGPAVDSEPATTAGTIAVLQRHAEGAMRLMVQSFSGVVDSYKEQLTAQRTLIAEFQKQAAENFRLQEELASRKLEQELIATERATTLALESVREESKLKQELATRTFGLEQLGKLGPALLHYITKGQFGEDPANTAAKRQVTQDVQPVPEIDEATVGEWRRTMPPELFAAVMEHMRGARARAAAEADKTAAGTTTEPATALQTETPASGPNDAGIIVAAQKFYEALCKRPSSLESLGMAFIVKRDYVALGPEQRGLIDDVAAEASPGEPQGDMVPQLLWHALLDRDPQAVAPVLASLKAAKAWAELPGPQKMQLMAIVRRAFSPAVAGEDQEHTPS